MWICPGGVGRYGGSASPSIAPHNDVTSASGGYTATNRRRFEEGFAMGRIIKRMPSDFVFTAIRYTDLT